METRKSKRRDSLERFVFNKKTNKSNKLSSQYERKYLFKYYPNTGKFIKTIS